MPITVARTGIRFEPVDAPALVIAPLPEGGPVSERFACLLVFADGSMNAKARVPSLSWGLRWAADEMDRRQGIVFRGVEEC